MIRMIFDKVIQKGYDQTYRVKRRFLTNETILLYDSRALNNKIAKLELKTFIMFLVL
jgi:hypothetical protein